MVLLLVCSRYSSLFFQHSLGADIVAGAASSVRGVIDAVGMAACVISNVRLPDAVSLPSFVACSGNKTVAIIGATEELTDKLAGAKLVYGAYHNTFSGSSVNAMWNGIITKHGHRNTENHWYKDLPVVSNSTDCVYVTDPVNAVNAVTHLVFYDTKGKNGSLSLKDVLPRLIELTDDTKAAVIEKVFEKCAISAASTTDEVLALIK